MRKIRFETMVPAELLEAVKGRSLVYLPVGSMEWHGPHMGMGMDTINAHAVALEAARRTGGVVMPPLYIGTETPRSPETLRKLGFLGDERIVGMDFPQNSVASFYWPPDLFEAIIRQQAQMLIEMGFSPLLISERLGYEDIKTTLQTYSHLYPNKQGEVAERLQSFF